MQHVETEVDGQTYRGQYSVDSDGFVTVTFGEFSDRADAGASAEAIAKRVLSELVRKSKGSMR